MGGKARGDIWGVNTVKTLSKLFKREDTKENTIIQLRILHNTETHWAWVKGKLRPSTHGVDT